MTIKALWFAIIPVVALLYMLLSDTQRPTVNRPATAAEQKQVTQRMTGWGKALAAHR